MSSLVARIRGAVFTPVALASPLAPEECLRRIAAITAPAFSLMKSRTEFPLAGSASSLAVSLRYRISYRNDYQRRLEGRVEPDGTGSVLRGVLRPTLIVRVISSIFSLVAVGFQAVLLVGLLAGKAKLGGGGDDFLYAFPLLMLLVVLGGFSFGLWLSRSAERRMLEILGAQLGATAISQALPPPGAAGAMPGAAGAIPGAAGAMPGAAGAVPGAAGRSSAPIEPR